MESLQRLFSGTYEAFRYFRRNLKRKIKPQTESSSHSREIEISELRRELNDLKRKFDEKTREYDEVIDKKLNVPLTDDKMSKRKVVLTFELFIDLLAVLVVIIACGYNFAIELERYLYQTVTVSYTTVDREEDIDVSSMLFCPFMLREYSIPHVTNSFVWQFEFIPQLLLLHKDVPQTDVSLMKEGIIEKLQIPFSRGSPQVNISCFLINYDMLLQFNSSDYSIAMMTYVILDNEQPYNMSTDDHSTAILLRNSQHVKKVYPGKSKVEHMTNDGSINGVDTKLWESHFFGAYRIFVSENRRISVKSRAESELETFSDLDPADRIVDNEEGKISYDYQLSSTLFNNFGFTCSEGFQQFHYAPSGIGAVNKCVGTSLLIFYYDDSYELIEEFWPIKMMDIITSLGGTLSFVGGILAIVYAILIWVVDKSYDVVMFVKDKKEEREEEKGPTRVSDFVAEESEKKSTELEEIESTDEDM